MGEKKEGDFWRRETEFWRERKMNGDFVNIEKGARLMSEKEKIGAGEAMVSSGNGK